jgi:hypothetical protein
MNEWINNNERILLEFHIHFFKNNIYIYVYRKVVVVSFKKLTYLSGPCVTVSAAQ